MLKAERYDADSPVSAHRQTPAGFNEQYADVSIWRCRRIEKPSRHHVVAARFEAQAGADPIEPLDEIQPPLRHGGSAQQGRAARDKAHWISGRVAVNAEKYIAHTSGRARLRLQADGTARRRCFHHRYDLVPTGAQ
jgi:hypothetical protein